MGRSRTGRLVDAYIGGRRDRREITKATYDNYQSVLRDFAHHIGDRDPKRIGQVDIERWIASRHHVAKSTLRLQVGVVRGFVRWMRINRHISHDPMLNIKTPKAPRRVPRALPPDSISAYRAVLPDRRGRAIHALLRLGLRRCEVVRAEIGDWDQNINVLWIRGKGDNERYIPVPAALAADLRQYFNEQRITAGPMIRRLDGTGPISTNYLGRLNMGWMEEAGLKARPHDGRACHSWRHTLASNMVDVEPDLRVTQEMLGHADLTSTQIYLRRASASKMRTVVEEVA